VTETVYRVPSGEGGEVTEQQGGGGGERGGVGERERDVEVR